MKILSTAALAAAFATSSTLAMLAGSATQAPVAHQTFSLAGPVIALADDEHGNGQGDDENKGKHHGEHGDENNNGSADNCTNPAGNEKGWCKHNKHKQHRGGNGTISGTVIGVNGNVATVRLDNGSQITVNENGTALNVGQHYNLSGCYQNNVFVVGCSNNGYNNGGYYGGQNQQQLSGTILGVGNGTITLVGVPPVTINVQQAINNNQTHGSLSIGRHVTVYGYYRNGTFVATSIQ